MCPDKFELAQWYVSKLNFKIMNDVEALGEKDGPLFISGDGGHTGIAIFSSASKADKDFSVNVIPAFELSPDDFVAYVKEQLSAGLAFTVYDHIISFSIYIVDPQGTKIELVSHQVAVLAPQLKALGIQVKKMNPVHDPNFRSQS